MKILFENRYTWSADDTKAIYFRSMLKNRRYIVAFVFLAFSLVGISYMLFAMPDSDIARFMAFVALALIVMSVIVAYYKHVRFVNDEYRNLLKSFGGKAPELCVQVTNSNIISKNAEGKGGSVDLSAVMRSAEDKKRFFLYSRTGELYILHKDGFTKGNPEEFKKFLREKSIYK